MMWGRGFPLNVLLVQEKIKFALTYALKGIDFPLVVKGFVGYWVVKTGISPIEIMQ